MLGLGWTEMLVIGVVALIFIGPKDLPEVMSRVGKIVGQIRRMGSEFQREINKTTGLDEVRNLRNSITQPLKKTSDDIRREFNAMTPTGPKPSGLIKPTDPSKESVVDAIKAQAGMATTPPAVVEPAKSAPVKAAIKPKTATKAKAPARAKAAPTAKVVAADLPPIEAVPAPAETTPVAKPARKPRTPKVVDPKPVPALPTEPADSPATKTPKARAPRKPAAKKPAATAGDN